MNEDLYKVIAEVSRVAPPATIESIAEALSRTGWSPENPTCESLSRRWSQGEAQAIVYTEDDVAFLDVIPRLIPPRWENADYSAAIDSDYQTALGNLRTMTDGVLAALQDGPPAEPRTEEYETGADFVEQGQWDVNGWCLSIGIAHTDEDLPILLMARLQPLV